MSKGGQSGWWCSKVVNFEGNIVCCCLEELVFVPLKAEWPLLSDVLEENILNLAFVGSTVVFHM